MSATGPRQALQQRVEAVILEGAARLLSVHGETASMSDVAAAAGVARATVYRYFPNRQALLDALTEVAASETDARLASARIDEVVPEEGIRRAVRALVDVGDSFTLLARQRARHEPEQFEGRVAAPLRRLFERGQETGDIRDDVATSPLTESLVALVVGVRSSVPPLGKEDAIDTITGLFLDGARARGPRRR
jgi:TetR/AcrR family transcriptional regulator, mexCD-oprJ operon repressor